MPKKIADYFKKPSSDYTSEYEYIISRNPLFAQSEKGLDINVIETSRITMHDPRWAELGVRYVISDRPLKGYDLLVRSNGRYFYENKKAVSMYRLIDTSNNEMPTKPIYFDPNQMVFGIRPEDVGKKLFITLNPDGFEAYMKGKKTEIEKDGLHLIIPLRASGVLIVRYSPLADLKQLIDEK